jgi:hypothetical protein
MTVAKIFDARLLVWAAILLLILSSSAIAGKRPNRPRRAPARIAFDKSDPQLGPNQSLEIRTTVMDAQGRGLPTARVMWKVVQGPATLVELRMPNATDVLIISATRIPEDSVITLRAEAGRASAELVVKLHNPEPSEIVFPDGNKIELPVQGHKTIKAYVLDSRGNRINDAEITWSLADPDHESFVLVGQNVNKDGVNSVQISWLGGKADLKTPSEVKVIARSGKEAHGVVRIDYKAPKPEITKLSAEPKTIAIRPGETQNVQITLRGEDERILKVEPSDIKAEIVDESARSFIKVAVQDGKTIALLGGYGDPKSPPPDVLNTALLVRVGSGLSSIPITYRRNAATVTWDILPQKIVGANYGRGIMSNYYCIEVTIHNHSGADLALAGLQFDGEIDRPNTSYTTVHGSLARRELTHPRTMTLAIVDSVGSLMTGFLPFFHNINHANNFSNLIALTSNPIAKGLERVWKDPVPDEMARFEKDVLHDDKIIPNASIFRTKIFVPKRALFENGDPARDDLKKVRKELGVLWLLGYKFQKGPVEALGSK